MFFEFTEKVLRYLCIYIIIIIILTYQYEIADSGIWDFGYITQPRCYHMEVDYFPITVCPEVFYFTYTTAICPIPTLISYSVHFIRSQFH